MSNLLGATRSLLNRAVALEIPLAEIARGAGSPVEYDWLKRFAADEIPDPSVNRVQHLHDHLIEKIGAKRPKQKQGNGGDSERRAASG